MNIEELKKEMMNGVVEFHFKKKDGSIRVAHGTLCAKYFGDMPKGTGPAKTGVLPYWDMDKSAWRSFIIENLI